MASPADGQGQQRYFCVAIDRPGYGRTPRDRQTIRSYPGKFIAEVCAALGRSSAYALVGSSQGARAVLNAVLELPYIAHFVAVWQLPPGRTRPSALRRCTTTGFCWRSTQRTPFTKFVWAASCSAGCSDPTTLSSRCLFTRIGWQKTWRWKCVPCSRVFLLCSTLAAAAAKCCIWRA
jgi:pimeloyl-ACP methyl ester carboxylesterase